MSFKNILSVLLFVAIVFTGCEKVDEPFIEGNPFTGVYDSDLPIRKILLEDFTGFKCVNCPRAAEKIHFLQNNYGGHVVPVSIHYGFFAEPNAPEDPDFITETGTEIGAAFGISEILPIGMINRININETYEVGYENWATEVTKILSVNKFADIGMEITSEYNDADSTAHISIEATVINSLQSNLYLSVMIAESHIIGKQKDGSEQILNYEHNHVLRGSVNGTWGEEISSNGVTAGDIINKSFNNFYINPEWVPANLSIIAILYDGLTDEVIQVEEHELITE